MLTSTVKISALCLVKKEFLHNVASELEGIRKVVFQLLTHEGRDARLVGLVFAHINSQFVSS